VTDGAVDVLDAATGRADQVVVVVIDSALEKSRPSGRLDPTNQACLDEVTECVVDRLQARPGNLAHDSLKQIVGAEVRVTVERVEHGTP